jgi:predicted ATPase/class 3 adenylate cyclase
VHESLSLYLPMDRRQALAKGLSLPDRAYGAALFADISGFTSLTEALALELGPQRGAEELTSHLSRVYDALISELDRYGGSVIAFSGDAITCWLDADDGLRAATCALAMHRAMDPVASVTIPSGKTVSLGMKVGIATGRARRFLIGDPAIQVRDVLAGSILDRLAAAEHAAKRGETLLDPDTAMVLALAGRVRFREWREDPETGTHFGVIDAVLEHVPTSPWQPLELSGHGDEDVRPYLLPAVYERLRSGQGDFLAELRPAVALFVQFGGIDYELDADAEGRLDAYIRQVQGILAAYEGNLIQLSMGDKGSYIYAALGAPQAHEDDAVRAISAAHQIRLAGANLVTGVRIGVAQGVMRTGAYGGNTRRTYDVLGDAVNLAARLMQAAQPGQILAPDAVAGASADAFTWEKLPDITVKGKQAQVTINALVGPKARRGWAHEASHVLPMVGRAAELEQIDVWLAQAMAGKGRVIGITGEAGMGKSRLVAETIRMAEARGVATYWGEAQSFGVNTSYLIWQTIWRAFFGVDQLAPAGERIEPDLLLEHLSAQLAEIDGRLALRAPLLGAVLNQALPDNDLTASFDAKLRKSSLEALLVDCVRHRTARGPLVFVLDECHWIDPLSHDLLEAIGRAAAPLPFLIVTAYRPPEQHLMAGDGLPPVAQGLRVSRLPHFNEVRLAGFSHAEAETLIGLKLEQFFGARFEASPELVQRITARAEGNPFYIAELLNYLKDRDIDPNDAGALAELDLPASLHRLILARIDQLTDSQRTTLRVASVVGRQFRAAAVWGSCPQCGEPQEVTRDLEKLSRLELTLVEPEPDLTYLFKHVVTQEVAYESLPYAMRSLLHGHIGEFLEHAYAEDRDQILDLLAFHFDRSENAPKKREYLLRAGHAAQAAYANAAAITYYRKALPLLPADEQPATLLRLGQVLELTGKWAEAAEVYKQGLELARQAGDLLAQARCQSAIGDLHRKQGMYDDAMAWLEQAQAAFQALGDEAGVGQVLHIEGTVAAQQGNPQRARQLYGASLDVRRKLDDRPQIANSLNNLGIVARSLDDLELARRLYEESLEIRRALNDRRAIAVSLNNLGNLALQQHNAAEARTRLEEAVSLQREVGDKHYLANALNNLGNVARDQGDVEAARSLYGESLALNRELGDMWQTAYLLEDVGLLAAREGRPQRAVRLAAAAAVLRQTIGAPRSAAEQAQLESNLRDACEALDAAERVAAEAQGAAMSVDQACDYARDFAAA